MEGVTVHFKLDDIVISLSLLVKLLLTTLKWLKYDGMAGHEDTYKKRDEEHGTQR